MNEFSQKTWDDLKFIAKLRESFKEVLKEKCSPQQFVEQNIDWEIKPNPALVDAEMTVT